MSYDECRYLGTTGIRKRDIGDREIAKEVYINPFLSAKLVMSFIVTKIMGLCFY